MKKACFALFLTITSLASCNSSKQLSVSFVSNTLTIDNLSLKQNSDYIATIDFIEENYNYRLPDYISLYVGNKLIDHNRYTYNKDTGYVSVGKSLIKDNLRIVAERKVIDGYQVNFDIDSHIHFYFYPTQDYSIEPIEDTIAIARDSSGNPTIDGTGEVNFKYTIDDNYDTDLFWMRGMCGEMEEVATGIYRIANIKDNVRVCVNTKKIYCKDLHASADYNSNSFTFSWTTKNISDVDHFKIDVIHNGSTTTYTTDSNSYTLNNVNNEELYQFIFTPILSNGVVGDPIEKDMMLSPASRNISFPRVEITTEDSTLPPYEVAYSPGKFNVTAANNDPVQSVVKIYDDSNTLQYDSSLNYSEDIYKGSKVKVRGNTSSVYSNGKESYKIKLAEKAKADLLDPFLHRSIESGGDAYQDQEWLLLNCGNQLNELGGFSIEESLGMPWIPKCQYVTLFMNNDFKGIYILCESINRGNVSGTTQARCPIDEDGYIIENDAYGWTENLTFKTRIHQDTPAMEYTFKYPDVDNWNYDTSEYKYIKNYVKDFEECFYSSPLDKEYSDYIDVESFARWTVAHDLMHVDDAAGSNMYIYKKDSKDTSKLTAGTTWDFDSAFIGNENPKYPKGLCYHRSSTIYYIRIFKYIDEFIQDTQNIFDAAEDNIITDFETSINYIKNKESIYDSLLEKEALRFGKPQVQFQPQKDQIEHYLSVQIQYINNHPYVDD